MTKIIVIHLSKICFFFVMLLASSLGVLFGALGWFLFVISMRVHKSPVSSNRSKMKRFTMTEPAEVAAIRESFQKISSKQPKNANYQQSAAVASELIASDTFLNVEHLFRKNAQRLFWIHRILGNIPEGGLGVRLTVQCNLFGGTVANLGSEKQIEWLNGVFERGELGCFLLTESGAGVLSGLIVNTTATWNGKEFILESPSPIENSRKCWISQGLCAKWGVVIARLILKDGTDKGPHAFIIDMDSDGIIKEDMPRKTEFNSLDNAWVQFKNVKLTRESLLSGISYVDENGDYKLVDEKQPFSFVTVAQRLLSGRICIAGASLAQLKQVIIGVEDYGSDRMIPTGRDQVTPLSSLPVMRDLIEKCRALSKVFEQYSILLENEFMKVDTLHPKLVDKIACAKIETIRFAINSIHELKEGVGSLSLFEHGPFGSQNDILYIFRFAEGDSAILQQKLVRDALKPLRSPVNLFKILASIPLTLLWNSDGMGMYRASLNWKLFSLVRKLNVSKSKQVGVWLESHALIKEVAHKKALLTIYDSVKSKMANTYELDLFKEYIHQ